MIDLVIFLPVDVLYEYFCTMQRMCSVRRNGSGGQVKTRLFMRCVCRMGCLFCRVQSRTPNGVEGRRSLSVPFGVGRIDEGGIARRTNDSGWYTVLRYNAAYYLVQQL